MLTWPAKIRHPCNSLLALFIDSNRMIDWTWCAIKMSQDYILAFFFSSFWLSVSHLLSLSIFTSLLSPPLSPLLRLYLSAPHSPSRPPPPASSFRLLRESVHTSEVRGRKVNCHEQTTTPQRVLKPVISYCECACACISSFGNDPDEIVFLNCNSHSLKQLIFFFSV